MNPETARSVSRTLGWIILLGTITLLPMAVVGVLSLKSAPAVGVMLTLGTVPGMVLATGGAAALIVRRLPGFYLIYVAAVISLFAIRIPFVPLPIQWLPFGAANGQFLRLLDLAVVGMLGWAHWTLLQELPPHRQRGHRVSLVGVAVIGLGLFGLWRTQFQRFDGQAASLRGIPHVGPRLPDLAADGPVEFQAVVTRVPPGVTVVFSGKMAETNFLTAVTNLQMTGFTPEHRSKFLGLVRSWKLTEPRFAGAFGTNDLYYSGRFPAGGRALLQLCLRRGDGRFTGQLLGRLPTNGE